MEHTEQQKIQRWAGRPIPLLFYEYFLDEYYYYLCFFKISKSWSLWYPSLFLKFVQSPCCTDFNTSASLAAHPDFQPIPYYSFLKCADSATACIAPLLRTNNMLKLGYELTLSANVFIFHGAHQNAFLSIPVWCRFYHLFMLLLFSSVSLLTIFLPLFSIAHCFRKNISTPVLFFISSKFSLAILSGFSCFEHCISLVISCLIWDSN